MLSGRAKLRREVAGVSHRGSQLRLGSLGRHPARRHLLSAVLKGISCGHPGSATPSANLTDWSTVSGVAAAPEGITNPPIDELLEKTSSKYGLVIFAAKRARQINAYYSQLGEGLLEYVGPLVDTAPQEKPLSIALREINENLLVHEQGEA